MKTEQEIRAEIEALLQYRKRLTTKAALFKFRLVKRFRWFFESLFQLAHVLGQEEMAKWILESPDAGPGLSDKNAKH
jgi:hypothetical protein